jgi:hypothetical protein
MKTIRKILSIVAVAGILLGSTMTVCAQNCDPVRSEVWVNAGSVAFTSQKSKKKTNKSRCYIRLVAYKIDKYPDNTIPPKKYVNARLYLGDRRTVASAIASFREPSRVGFYNYDYMSGGVAMVNNYYCLRSNCTLSNSYWAKFDWSPDPF